MSKPMTDPTLARIDMVSLAIVSLASKLSRMTVDAPPSMKGDLDAARKLLIDAEHKLWLASGLRPAGKGTENE